MKRMLKIVGVYLLLNVVVYFVNPYGSKWHYQDHNPIPIVVEQPADSSLSAQEIEETLDEIDLAYRGREATTGEMTMNEFMCAMQWVFLPASIALAAKSFMGYMGPATQAQQAFTLSVKRRYNHLVKLGTTKGMQKKGFYFLEDPSLEKKSGEAY